MTQIKHFLVLLIIVWPNYVGAQFHIQLLDQNKEPVNEAVISIPTEIKPDNSAQMAIMDQIDRQFVPKVLT